MDKSLPVAPTNTAPTPRTNSQNTSTNPLPPRDFEAALELSRQIAQHFQPRPKPLSTPTPQAPSPLHYQKLVPFIEAALQYYEPEAQRNG